MLQQLTTQQLLSPSISNRPAATASGPLIPGVPILDWGKGAAVNGAGPVLPNRLHVRWYPIALVLPKVVLRILLRVVLHEAIPCHLHDKGSEQGRAVRVR